LNDVGMARHAEDSAEASFYECCKLIGQLLTRFLSCMLITLRKTPTTMVKLCGIMH
jgi:hypothetical protein